MNRGRRLRRSKRRGSLTFEWIVIVTIMGIGLVSALAVVRNELVNEFAEIVNSICATDVCE